MYTISPSDHLAYIQTTLKILSEYTENELESYVQSFEEIERSLTNIIYKLNNGTIDK